MHPLDVFIAMINYIVMEWINEIVVGLKVVPFSFFILAALSSFGCGGDLHNARKNNNKKRLKVLTICIEFFPSICSLFMVVDYQLKPFFCSCACLRLQPCNKLKHNLKKVFSFHPEAQKSLSLFKGLRISFTIK